MLISLTTRGFRNLADRLWTPKPGVNLVYGPNGAGKSSLLEAIYLVATTRSFRTSRLTECCRIGEAEFFLGADTEGSERVRLEVSWGAEGKRRAANGKRCPIIEHLAVIPVVSWTSRDNEIFQGAPAVRRRLLDRGVVTAHPAALASIREYRRALETKRAALDSRTGMLEEWNRLLARTGSELAERRARWVERLDQALAGILEASDFALGRVELRYRPSPPQALEGVECLFETLEGLARTEVSRQTVLAGQHRDDLEILWRNGPVGRMASAGERKLLGLALMVAQADLLAERGSQPLFLVDDLDAELDRERVDQAWQLLRQAPQLVAATSRKGVVNGLAAGAKWQLDGGIATAA